MYVCIEHVSNTQCSLMMPARLRAHSWQPWSGHYTVNPTVWASAHTTQFTEPGWTMLHGGSGNLEGGGSYVSMVSPSGADFTVVVETGVAKCGHCRYSPDTAAYTPQMIELTLMGSLSSIKTVSVWQTTANPSFVQLPAVAVTGGTFTVLIEPGSIYSISSTTGQSRGAAATLPPPSARFPTSHTDTFESYPLEGMAKYWADQCGSFQVCAPSNVRDLRSASNGWTRGQLNGDVNLQVMPNADGQALRQRVVQVPGVNQWAGNLDAPLTILGDPVAKDFTVSITLVSTAPPANEAEWTPRTAVEPKLVPHASSRIQGGTWKEDGTYTLGEAQALCLKTLECNGITWQGGTIAPDPAQKLDIWLTSREVYFASPGWQTFVLDPPHPPPPPPAVLGGGWASLCGRVPFVGQTVPVAGVCLGVNSTSWLLVENGSFVAEGALSASAEGVPVVVSLSFTGLAVNATVGGKSVGLYAVGVHRGMVGLRSGWNVAEFDNFSLSGN
jgi:hypothetical protein